MTAVEVYDTNTGTALTVHEVTAALDHTETPMLWADAIDAVHIRTRGRTFATALSEMRAAMQLAGDRLDELGIGRVPEPEPEPAPELPPTPAVAGQVYDQAKGWVPDEYDRQRALGELTRRVTVHPSVLVDRDTRVEQMIADPEEYFARARERARRQVLAESEPETLRPPWTRRVKTWASGWAEWLKPSGGEPDDR